MEKEDRYIVIKRSDLKAALAQKLLGSDDAWVLDDILHAIRKVRRQRNKGELKAVVVESDWPIYEEVWEMLEESVDESIRQEYERGWENAKIFYAQNKEINFVRGISHYCRGWNDYMRFEQNES